jgi:negative regulator of flagellin synthesis FlgM
MEVTMSYTSGIDSTQLLLTAVSTASTSTSATSRTQLNEANGAGSAGSVQSGDGDDHTTFSTTGSLIAQASGSSDVRMEKVAALQQAIAGGTYNVPASDVADKLISALTR